MLEAAVKAAYEANGYAAPFRALAPAEAVHYRAELEKFESERGGPVTAIEDKFRYKTHLLLPWVADLVRHPRILAAVSDVIGPDLLVWTCTWFVKEPYTDAQTVWHQDATYFGLRPHEHVTAWLAITDANEANGCMRFVPGTSQQGQLKHIPRAEPNSINGGGQRTERDFSLDAGRLVPLRAGEFSLHHTLCVHASGPNQTGDRRIGLGISYIPTRVAHIGTGRMPASLVRGLDQYGHFDLEPAPRRSGDDAYHYNLQRFDESYQKYREGYREQMAWHSEGRGW